MKKILRALIFPLLLLLVIVLFFLPFFNGQSIPYAGDLTGSDLTELNLPLRFLAAESWKNGEVPLWTNLLSNGFPLLAEGQAGVFYPFNILLFTALPFIWAVNMTFLVNFYLAGLFTYLYSRVIKISQTGSFLAALTFSFSGFFVFRLKHLNLINAAIWFPLQLYLIERYFSAKRKDLVLIILSLVFVIQFFAGHPQIFYISAISCFLYFCLRYFSDSKISLKNILFKVVMPWAVIAVLVSALAAIQLLPTFSYAYTSSRGLEMVYENVTEFAYFIPSLLTFISPYALGNPAAGSYMLNVREFGIFWENNIYFGVLPFILAVFGFIFMATKKNIGRIFAVLAVISFLFILGDKSPFFILFWKLIPGFEAFRFPQRFLLLTLFSLIILAALSFDYLVDKLKQLLNRYEKIRQSKMLFSHLIPLLIIFLVAIDLFIYSYGYIGVMDYEKYLKQPQSAELLEGDNFKIYSLNWPLAWNSAYRLSGGWQNNLSLFMSQKELIPPNSNVFWNIASFQDRASSEGGLLDGNLYNLNTLLSNNVFTGQEEEDKATVDGQALRILGANNVKYLLSYDSLEDDNLVLTGEVKDDFLPPLNVYENGFYQPFAYGVFSDKIALFGQNSLAMLFDKGFDPATEVILEEKRLTFSGDSKNHTADVEMRESKRGELDFDVDFSHDGYLYISQVFLPGWQAFIDGQPVEILRANHAFTALAVSSGTHEITLKYQPLSYSIGKLISIVSIILSLVYLLFYYVYVRRKRFS